MKFRFAVSVWSLLGVVTYEARLVLLVWRLFGSRKAASFLTQLPRVFREGSNRAGYLALGKCRLSVDGKVVMFTHPDVRFIDEVILRDCYMSAWLLENSSGLTVIDAGANVGTFAVWASVFSSSNKVFAIEPEAVNFSFLEDNIRANNLGNIFVENVALSGETGQSVLHLKRSGSNTLRGTGRGVRTQNCKSITVSDFLESHSIDKIDFFKIDIEGSEFEIFKRAEWLEKVRAIAMEVHLDVGPSSRLIRQLQLAKFRVRTRHAYDGDSLYVYARRNDW